MTAIEREREREREWERKRETEIKRGREREKGRERERAARLGQIFICFSPSYRPRPGRP